MTELKYTGRTFKPVKYFFSLSHQGVHFNVLLRGKHPTHSKKTFQFKGATDYRFYRFSYINPIVYLKVANLPCISLELFLLSPWWHFSPFWLSQYCCLQSCAVKRINTMTQVRSNYPRIRKKKPKEEHPSCSCTVAHNWVMKKCI